MWGRAGRRGRAWPYTSPARTRSTSSSAATPTNSSAGRSRRRSSIHDSPEIYAEHLLCAAHEAPLSDADAEISGRVACPCRGAERRWILRERADGFRAQARRRLPGGPRRAPLGLRRQLRPDRRRLGRADRLGRGRPGLRDVHEGAVYLHLGRSYEVRELDLDDRRALLEPFSGDYFTQAKRESMTYIERLARSPRGPRRHAFVRLGRVLGDRPRLPAQGPSGPRGDRLPRRSICRRSSSRPALSGTSSTS